MLITYNRISYHTDEAQCAKLTGLYILSVELEVCADLGDHHSLVGDLPLRGLILYHNLLILGLLIVSPHLQGEERHIVYKAKVWCKPR